MNSSNSEIVTTTTQLYMDAFAGMYGDFLRWGMYLFLSLVVINCAWLFLWNAFDKQTLTHGISSFVKKYFVMLLFFTVMTHPNWLISMLETAIYMGKRTSGIAVDPSSIIAAGISVANLAMKPFLNSSLLMSFPGAFVSIVTAGVVIYFYFKIAWDLAVALITCTALISLSSFFLGFAGLGATSDIAKRTIETILAHCVQILGIYIIVGVGSKAAHFVAEMIPDKVTTFDPYLWVIAISGLFYGLARHLPHQLARIITGSFHDAHHSSEMAAFAVAAASTSRDAASAFKKIATMSTGAVQKITAATLNLANASMKKSMGASGSNLGASSSNGSVSKGSSVSARFKRSKK